jgi:hypothetical protein
MHHRSVSFGQDSSATRRVPIIRSNEIVGMPPAEAAEFLYHKLLDAAGSGGLPWDQITITLHLLPQKWRMIYTVCWLQAEVDNGGHDQFFYNGRGEFDADTEADLRFLGAVPFLELFIEARRLYYSAPANRTDRIPEHAPLDDAFYAQKKTLHHWVGEHVLSHLSEYCED